LIQIKRNSVVILDNAPYQGNETDCLQETGTTIYTLEASNTTSMVSEDKIVEVVPTGTENPLAGTSWDLLSYLSSQGTTAPVVEGTNVTASFGARGEVFGFGGCNAYSATYSANNSSISIGAITSTSMVCDNVPGMMEQEAAYFIVLPTAVTFQTGRGQLSLNNTSAQNIAAYQQLVATPLSIQ
jgi:heat shock protein HslJ